MTGRVTGLVLDPMRAGWRGAVAWGVSIGLLIAVTVAFWPAFRGTTELIQFIDQLPAAVVEAFGMQGFATPAGYLRGNLYDLIVPLLLGAASIALADGLTAAEEDAGRLELILVQPVTRLAAFGGRAAALVAWNVVLTGFVAVIQLAADVPFDLRIETGRLAATIALCGLLAILHGSLAFAVAGFSPRPAAVLGTGLAVLIAGFVVAALFPLSEPLRPWTHISPWDWAFAGDPLVNGAEAWRYLALIIPSVALLALGLAGFARRDVRSA